MISLWFNIWNFGKSIHSPGENATDWCRDWKVTENKYLEVQLTHWDMSRLLSITLDTHVWGTDHAGPEFTIEVLGWYFSIKLYDRRHWNYDAGRFQTDAEAQAETAEWQAQQTSSGDIKLSAGASNMTPLYSEWNDQEEVDTQRQPS